MNKQEQHNQINIIINGVKYDAVDIGLLRIIRINSSIQKIRKKV